MAYFGQQSQKSAEKCQKMPKNAKKMSEYVEKCRKMPNRVKILVPKNARKCQKMPKNAKKNIKPEKR